MRPAKTREGVPRVVKVSGNGELKLSSLLHLCHVVVVAVQVCFQHPVLRKKSIQR